LQRVTSLRRCALANAPAAPRWLCCLLAYRAPSDPLGGFLGGLHLREGSWDEGREGGREGRGDESCFLGLKGVNAPQQSTDNQLAKFRPCSLMANRDHVRFLLFKARFFTILWIQTKKILPPTFSRNHPASTCQWSGRPWRYGKVKEILGMHPGRPSLGRVRVSVASAAIMYHPFYRQKILTTTVQGHLNRLSGINKRHDQEKTI